MTEAEGRFGIGHVGDEGVEGGTAFCGINQGHGGIICRIGAEAIDGLGGEGDELALTKGFSGCGDFIVGRHGGSIAVRRASG